MLPWLKPKSFWNRSHRSPWIAIIEPLIVACILRTGWQSSPD
jgi:hypothetical protein